MTESGEEEVVGDLRWKNFMAQLATQQQNIEGDPTENINDWTLTTALDVFLD